MNIRLFKFFLYSSAFFMSFSVLAKYYPSIPHVSKIQNVSKIQKTQKKYKTQKKQIYTKQTQQDPLMHKKWDLKKANVEKTWNVFSKGNKNIIVAVIDTGIDVHHPDLKDNIWVNPKEIPGNNIDDDKNGYIDDTHGWNFVHNNNDLTDTNGHGTHIAGIIGAKGGNGIGVSGVSTAVSLMVLKFYDPNVDGKSNLINTIKSIRYAVKNGAHIINYSGGGTQSNEAEKKAIQEAEAKGILFVAASGNEKSNMDKSPFYPASYNLSNILAVTATNPKDNVLSSSNYGKSVHTAAPGNKIFSTLPQGRYGPMTGTSQATAFATGTSVLVMDFFKTKKAAFVIKQLTMTGDYNQSLEGKTKQGKRHNTYKALQARNNKLDFNDQKIEYRGVIISTETQIVPSYLPKGLDIVHKTLLLTHNQPKPSDKKIKYTVLSQKIPSKKNNNLKYKKNYLHHRSSYYNGKIFSITPQQDVTKKTHLFAELQTIKHTNKMLAPLLYQKNVIVTVSYKNKAQQFIIKKSQKINSKYTKRNIASTQKNIKKQSVLKRWSYTK